MNLVVWRAGGDVVSSADLAMLFFRSILADAELFGSTRYAGLISELLVSCKPGAFPFPPDHFHFPVANAVRDICRDVCCADEQGTFDGMIRRETAKGLIVARIVGNFVRVRELPSKPLCRGDPREIRHPACPYRPASSRNCGCRGICGSDWMIMRGKGAAMLGPHAWSADLALVGDGRAAEASGENFDRESGARRCFGKRPVLPDGGRPPRRRQEAGGLWPSG